MESYTKEEVALTQLEDAIDIFQKKRYLSAITLGGAAEEILAKLADEKDSKKLGRKSERNQASLEFELIQLVFNAVKTLKDSEWDFTAKQYYEKRNYERNALKHYDSGFEEVVASDQFREKAIQHICGAVTNYKFLHEGKLPSNSNITNFYHENGYT